MIDPDVQRMARAADEGDYVAFIPLIDRLKELDDDRWRSVVSGIGVTLRLYPESPPRLTSDSPEPGEVLARRQEGRYIDGRMSNLVRELFWPELCLGGAAGALGTMAGLANEWREYRDSPQYDIDQASAMDGGMLAAGHGPTQAPDAFAADLDRHADLLARAEAMLQAGRDLALPPGYTFQGGQG